LLLEGVSGEHKILLGGFASDCVDARHMFTHFRVRRCEEEKPVVTASPLVVCDEAVAPKG